MNKSWSNTVLVAYSLLPKIAREIDLGVKTRVNSGFQSKHLKTGVTTEQLIGEIIELNDEKLKIVNLRYIVSDALNLMPEIERQILIARIVRKHTFQQLTQDFNISLRTAFRRVENAELKFAKILASNGYDENWFEKEYGNNKYIAPINQRIVSDKYFIAKNL